MPNRNPAAPVADDGVITTAGGIVLPPTYHSDPYLPTRTPGAKLKALLSRRNDVFGRNQRRGYAYGYQLERDKDCLIVRWPEKLSGIDDALSAAIVDGTIANAGISPVVMPQISAMVKRQEAQARSADITLTGRTTPVNAARDAIERSNDSPLGATQFIGQLTYQLRTFNRGAPMATVPITYPIDLWPEEGLMAIPLDGGENTDPTTYYLEVDWAKRRTAIPYLPDVWDLEPSGNPEWPYWYRKEIDGRMAWVLLHNSQIIGLLPMTAFNGTSHVTSHRYPIGGTSTVYMLWTVLADQILMVDARTERIINRLTDGFLGIGGVDQEPEEIQGKIEAEAQTDNAPALDNYTIFTSEERVQFDSFSFRQNDVPFDDFKRYAEDLIALAFEEPLQAVVQRGGLSVQQSEAAAENAADAGVNSILDLIGKALGAIYPRVQVSVSRQNDAAQRLNIGMFKDFADAVRSLPEDTFTREEVRAIVDRDIFEIPETGPDTKTEGATPDQDDTRDSDLEALSPLIDRLILESWAYESIEDALDSGTMTQLINAIVAGLRESYESVDIADLVTLIRETETDPNDVDAIADLIDANDMMDSAADTTDTDLLLVLLLALAVMGINQAGEDAAADDEEGYTGDQRDAAIDDSSTFLTQRIGQLYEEASGNASGDIDDFRLDDTLDVESRATMGRLTSDAMRRNDDEGVPGAVAILIPAAAATRGAMIGTVEGGRAHGYGHLTGGRILGALFKTWLLTFSENPRVEHLDTVGETVGINERFSNGDSWSQERIQCKCGIALRWQQPEG